MVLRNLIYCCNVHEEDTLATENHASYKGVLVFKEGRLYFVVNPAPSLIQQDFFSTNGAGLYRDHCKTNKTKQTW